MSTFRGIPHVRPRLLAPSGYPHPRRGQCDLLLFSLRMHIITFPRLRQVALAAILCTALIGPELCELMRAAQLDTYGDGLERSTLHPYMWAVKPHYYSSAYYNWPYCFGLLFGT